MSSDARFERSSVSMVFGTKAATLASLRICITQATVCPCLAFSVASWAEKSASIVAKVQSDFPAQLIIVRSSAMDEDGFGASMAGAFDSVKNVDTGSREDLRASIDHVIASYGTVANDLNEVLIQPMIQDVSMSGVVFSHDLSTGAPYYVINYDDQSGQTDTVTSGTTDISRTLLIFRNEVDRLQSRRFQALLRAVREIEHLTGASGLDIEFAVSRTEEIYIFQVRPMAVSRNWNRDIARNVNSSLAEIQKFLQAKFAPSTGVLGNSSLFGEMPDWNPAEMIGTVPRPLARSLYEKLITNSSWAEARAELGYRDLTGRPLMVSLGGHVYIDVRESFNSYLPADLPEAIGEKLVNAWLAYLRDNPELHDKVEFDVATTVLSLSFDCEREHFLEYLSEEELAIFRKSLLCLTNNIVCGAVGGKPDIYSKLDVLDARRKNIGPLAEANLESVRNLLSDCIRFGTIPFASMARCAFVAETMLRSIEATGALSAQTVIGFRASIQTVLTSFLEALHNSYQGPSAWQEFVETYGHLRPGTYDILAGRYDQHAGQLGQASGEIRHAPTEGAPFALGLQERQALDAALAEAGFEFDSDRLFGFMREAIAGREYAKLVFTRNVSDAIELVAFWGAKNGLSRDELSYLHIDQILESLTQTRNEPLELFYREQAKSAREVYQVSQALRLPYLIASISDIYVVPMLKTRPNFITTLRVQAGIHYLSDHAFESARCAGKIVMIERADPGYDWIFLSPIAGLVTKYGGANSHMAIRCAELGVPAAIGCGEQIFEHLLVSSSVLLDCAAGVLVPIH